MDKVVESIFDLIPIAPLLEWIGVGHNTSAGLATILTALLIWGLIALVKYLYNHNKNSRAARDLKPYFYLKDVIKHRKWFIESNFQNASPTKEDEPGFSNPFVAKKRLISHFLNTSFDDKKESKKFYLILADSGMGKTTFMINLYVRYHSFFNHKQNYKMRLFPFRDPRILDKIKEIEPEEAKDTILLLDAFDEDKGLLQQEGEEVLSEEQRFRRRMDEIIETVQDFREVIITSRTQYFPGQEDQEYELKVPRYDGKGFHTLGKLYLSPFDEKDIRKFLNKKFGRLRIWNRKKKKRAWKIVTQAKRLMVRPMLLDNIDLLVNGDQNFHNTYEIYETMIEGWIDREAKRKERKDQEGFKKALHEFSRHVALKIFEDRNDPEKGDSFSLTKNEAKKIARDHQLDLRDDELTGKSLLTRDANHTWKFAHKSFLEYFLAKEALEVQGFRQKSNFTGMDLAVKFINEVDPMNLVIVKGGTLLRKSLGDNISVDLPDFQIGKYPVTLKQWREITGREPAEKYFSDCEDCPVVGVSWEDVKGFIKQLNKQTKKQFRLPSESEWEFAARGGVLDKGYEFSGSNQLDEVGWFTKNSENETHPVGGLAPNELGIFDMSGNVWEWCEDIPEENSQKVQLGGSPIMDKYDRRVLRGGSLRSSEPSCKVNYVFTTFQDTRFTDIGFRLAHSL